MDLENHIVRLLKLAGNQTFQITASSCKEYFKMFRSYSSTPTILFADFRMSSSCSNPGPTTMFLALSEGLFQHQSELNHDDMNTLHETYSWGGEQFDVMCNSSEVLK